MNDGKLVGLGMVVFFSFVGLLAGYLGSKEQRLRRATGEKTTPYPQPQQSTQQERRQAQIDSDPDYWWMRGEQPFGEAW